MTWPTYFVELVRTLEEQRRREGDNALGEEGVISGDESDGMLSDDDSSNSSSGSRSSRTARSSKAGAGKDAGSDGAGGSEDDSEDEEDGVDRDPLEALCAAFQAGEYHLLPLEMKVQALEYLVDRAMEVCEVGEISRSS